LLDYSRVHTHVRQNHLAAFLVPKADSERKKKIQRLDHISNTSESPESRDS